MTFSYMFVCFRLENGHINFAKALQLAEKLKEFSNWKDVECPYAKTPAVADFLQFSPVLSENGNIIYLKCFLKITEMSFFSIRFGVL